MDAITYPVMTVYITVTSHGRQGVSDRWHKGPVMWKTIPSYNNTIGQTIALHSGRGFIPTTPELSRAKGLVNRLSGDTSGCANLYIWDWDDISPPRLGILWHLKLECAHNIITRDANSLSWNKLWEFQKWQCDVTDEVIITKIIIFTMICYTD